MGNTKKILVRNLPPLKGYGRQSEENIIVNKLEIGFKCVNYSQHDESNFHYQPFLNKITKF
jgi:hypothetical protein